MKVRNAMHAVLSVSPEDPLELAAQVMLWSEGRHLPVMADRELVGVISERDILRYRAGHAGLIGEGLVSDAMSVPAQYIEPDASIAEAAERLSARKVGCLPVLEEGELVGIVTTTDVLSWQARDLFETPPIERRVVGELMTRNPSSVEAGDRVLDAAAVMATVGARHLPVIDGARRVVGMLSERDIRAAIGGPLAGPYNGAREDLAHLRVEAMMTMDPVVAREDTPLSDLLPWFIDWRTGAIPVVDDTGRLSGIVSYVDALRALSPSAAQP